MDPMTMVFFLIAAVFVNGLTYGMVTWVYFRDKNAPVPARGAAVRTLSGKQAEAQVGRAKDAA